MYYWTLSISYLSLPYVRVYLNIIYTIVEVMRYAEPDSEELAQAREMFFTELSKYLIHVISVPRRVLIECC